MSGPNLAATAAIGDPLPVFERTVDFGNWNRYAAVNDEFIPIHMDDDAGRAAGHAGAIGMGNLGIAHLHCLLRDWMGPQGRILTFEVQFRQPSARGATTRARGQVTAVEPGTSETLVSAEIWIEDGAGTVLTRGTTRVAVPAEDAGG